MCSLYNVDVPLSRLCLALLSFFFFKQKTAYEMRISDWSSDVCSSDLVPIGCGGAAVIPGDIIVGDGDGVVVIPRHLAAEVARGGVEQERIERDRKSVV